MNKMTMNSLNEIRLQHFSGHTVSSNQGTWQGKPAVIPQGSLNTCGWPLSIPGLNFLTSLKIGPGLAKESPIRLAITCWQYELNSTSTAVLKSIIA